MVTSHGTITAGFIVNCAGLYADRIAKDFGFCQRYTILPFKGLYLYSDEPAGRLHTHIYPVPDLKYPFLGVHFTVTVDGHTKIGPTAIRTDCGAQPTESEEVLSTALGGDWEFRGIRGPKRG